jgi:hypothetical protein
LVADNYSPLLLSFFFQENPEESTAKTTIHKEMSSTDVDVLAALP